MPRERDYPELMNWPVRETSEEASQSPVSTAVADNHFLRMTLV